MLTLRSADKDTKPLTGYDVFVKPYSGSTTEHVGRSDLHGQVRLSRSPHVLNTYYVKHGGLLLAKLPIVVGQLQEVSIALRDDSLRMTVEGFLRGVEDRLIDAIVVRETHLQRARQLILREGFHAEDLERINAEIKMARESDRGRELIRLMQSRKTEFHSPDRQVQDRIDRMFSDLRRAIQRGLTQLPSISWKANSQNSALSSNAEQLLKRRSRPSDLRDREQISR